MNFDQLRYFCVVAEEENFSKASRRLSISQQGLSANIIKLERELGVYLFDRKGHSVYLNETGRIFKKHAELLLADLKTAQKEIHREISENRHTIRLKMTSSSLASLLVTGYLSCTNNIDFDVELIRDGDIPVLLSPGRDNFIISSSVYENDAISCAELFEDGYTLIVSQYHALAERSSISLSELNGLPFALSPQEAPFRKNLDALFKKAGCRPEIVLTSNSNDTIIQAVQSGQVISVWGSMPKFNDPLFEGRNIKQIPINDPFAKRMIYMYWRKDMINEQYKRDFLKYTRENAADLIKNPL